VTGQAALFLILLDFAKEECILGSYSFELTLSMRQVEGLQTVEIRIILVKLRSETL
jgi:hypothetical protein